MSRKFLAMLGAALFLSAPTVAQAWTFETPTWLEESNREWSEREAAKEREAKEATAQEEKKAAEAKESREAAEKRAEQEQAPTPIQPAETNTTEAPATLQCVVPSLVGHSLSYARRALDNGHCKLGKITTPRRHGHTLVVIEQSRPRGKQLPDGTAVAIRLGSASSKHS